MSDIAYVFCYEVVEILMICYFARFSIRGRSVDASAARASTGRRCRRGLRIRNEPQQCQQSIHTRPKGCHTTALACLGRHADAAHRAVGRGCPGSSQRVELARNLNTSADPASPAARTGIYSYLIAVFFRFDYS